jgi:hypothetical protein
MKTFREFILEAKIDWWTGGRGKAKRREAQLSRDRTGTPQQQATRMKQLKKLKQAISNVDSQESDTKPKETEKQKRQRTRVVKNTGRAQQPRDVISSSGTLPGIRKTTVPEPSDTIRRNKDGTSGRYGTTFGGGGTGKSRSGGNIG